MIPGAECDLRYRYGPGKAPGCAGVLAHPGGFGLTLRAIELARLNKGARVLDLGCGSGESVQLLRAIGIDAIGLDHALLSLHRSAAENGSCVEASAEELPFADSSMDGVLAECSLSEMWKPQRVLAECARVLCPGGRLMISDIYARNSNSQAIRAIRSLQGTCASAMFVREELESWLHEAGFAPQCFEDHSCALREFVARFIFDHGSIEPLWEEEAHASNAQAIAAAMKQARAGYFLQISTYVEGRVKENGNRDAR